MPKTSEKSEVQTPSVPMAPKSIEVVATAKGFYKQARKVEGDKFSVAKFEQLGSWMKCVDPVMQKKHIENQAAIKAKIRAGK